MQQTLDGTTQQALLVGAMARQIVDARGTMTDPTAGHSAWWKAHGAEQAIYSAAKQGGLWEEVATLADYLQLHS